MSRLFPEIIKLIKNGEILISSHGYDELANDNIFIKDLIESIDRAKVIKEYPEYSKGPCVLVLQYDKSGNPVHVVWGIPANLNSPAVLVTSYRPDPGKWDNDFIRRKK